ncbi:MAG: hypothetical protein ABL921_34590 [Pirellula sp.]
MCVGLSRFVSATVYITANTGRLATGVGMTDTSAGDVLLVEMVHHASLNVMHCQNILSRNSLTTCFAQQSRECGLRLVNR